jgi:ATP-dependent Clp protease ATP-binding subunit ClpX
MLAWLRQFRGRGRYLACSFCGRSEHQVVNLVAGAHAYICDDCVDTCSAVVAAERESRSRP